MTKKTDGRNKKWSFFFSLNEPALTAISQQRNGMTIQFHNANEKHVLKNHDLIYL